MAKRRLSIDRANIYLIVALNLSRLSIGHRSELVQKRLFIYSRLLFSKRPALFFKSACIGSLSQSRNRRKVIYILVAGTQDEVFEYRAPRSSRVVDADSKLDFKRTLSKEI